MELFSTTTNADNKAGTGFFLFPAFSVETLATKLAEEIRNNRDPIEPEIVLATNYAQGAWLRQFLARKNGICANVKFLSPEQFLNYVIGAATRSKSDKEALSPEPLALRIFKVLKSRQNGGNPLFSFRDNRDEDLIVLSQALSELFWTYQSSRPEMIAAWQNPNDPKFPDAVELAYKAGKKLPQDFRREYRRQRDLWRELDTGDVEPPAVRHLKFLRGDNDLEKPLPKRVFVFAPTTLPRIHFELLEKLSARTRVLFYYHNLSTDLWTETAEAKRLLREQLKNAGRWRQPSQNRAGAGSPPLSRPQLGSEENWLAMVAGNELLTAWGKAARPLAMRLIDDGFLDGNSNIDAAPARDNLLHALQAEIRENVADDNGVSGGDVVGGDHQGVGGDGVGGGNGLGGGNNEDCRHHKLPPHDESFLVNVAHTPLREMEILLDDLTKLFATNPDMRAKDVLIMLPNIEEYAPLIRAVFTKSPFPFSIADKTTLEHLPAISAFFDILKIATGEFRISEIVRLLECPPLARKLGLSEETDVPALQKLLLDSNIRWGISGDHRREEFDKFDRSPEKFSTTVGNYDDEHICRDNEKDEEQKFSEDRYERERQDRFFKNNSWRFGMRRNALGIMLGDDNDAQTAISFGNEPWISAQKISDSATAAGLLGKFYVLLETLEYLHDEFSSKKRHVKDWCDILRDSIGEKLLDFDDDNEKQMLQRAFADIRDAENLAGFSGDFCEAKTVIKLLEARSWENERISGMLRGRLTFCRMQPLRNIPARAIYVAGMNSGAFPRGADSSSLDLCANWAPALDNVRIENWDCTARDKDCLLLLEVLLAAKDFLRFSYVGREASSNAKLPPATPLAKLIESANNLSRRYGNAAPDFVREHRLHSFEDPESFGEIALLLSRQSEAATKEKREPALPHGLEFPLPLSPDEIARFGKITLEDLQNFFVDPAEFIVTRRLNLRKDWQEDEISDDEPADEMPNLYHSIPEFFEKHLQNNYVFSGDEEAASTWEFILDETRDARSRGEISALTDTRLSACNPSSPNNILSKTGLQWIVTKAFPGKNAEFVSTREHATFELDVALPSGCPIEKVSVVAKFKSVFRNKDTGEEVFVLFPRKNSGKDWCRKIAAIVAFVFIRRKFPHLAFRVMACSPRAKSEGEIPMLGSGDDIPAEISPEFFAENFVRGLGNPPLLFPEIPEKETVGGPVKFREAAIDEWEKSNYCTGAEAPQDRFASTIVFGGDLDWNSPFDFVEKISRLFPASPKKPQEKKRACKK